MSVRANLRILLAVLSLGCAVLIPTGLSVLVLNSNLLIRSVVVVIFLFFLYLLWTLREGHRRRVAGLYTVVISLLLTIPQLDNAFLVPEIQKLDQLAVQILLQLVLIAAITEKASLLVIGYGLMATMFAIEAFGIVLPQTHQEAILFQRATRLLLNITLAEGILLLVQQAFHRAVGQVEAANQTLEAKVQQRTEQVRLAQKALVEGERLALLGRLVASVAHEINTPLAAIQSSNSTMRAALPEVLGRAVSLFRRLTAEQEEVLIDLLDRSLGAVGIQGVERRRVVKEVTAVLTEWGSISPSELADQLVEAGVYEVAESWRSLLTDPEVNEVGQFVVDFASVLRACRIVDTATQKASHYILALRQYLSDQSAPTPNERVDVTAGLEAVLVLMKGQIPAGIELASRLDAGLAVWGQPARLMQLWSSLLHQALAALGAGGVVSLNALQQGDEIVVVVARSGGSEPSALPEAGIPWETDQGLSTATLIVQEHSGHLAATEDTNGQSVEVRLPAAATLVRSS